MGHDLAVLAAHIRDQAVIRRLASLLQPAWGGGASIETPLLASALYFALCRLRPHGATLGEEMSELRVRGAPSARLLSVLTPLVVAALLRRLGRRGTEIGECLLALNEVRFFILAWTTRHGRSASPLSLVDWLAGLRFDSVAGSEASPESRGGGWLAAFVGSALAVQLLCVRIPALLAMLRNVKGSTRAPPSDESVLFNSKHTEQSSWSPFGLGEPQGPTCSICLCPTENPTATRCGHVFCWQCIVQWHSMVIGIGGQCPDCRSAIAATDLLALQHYAPSTDTNRPPWATSPLTISYSVS